MNSTLNKIFVILPPFLWLILLFFIPFLIIIIVSFSEYADATPPYNLFFDYDINTHKYKFAPDLTNFKFLIEDPIYLGAYLNSIKIAAISTITTLLIAYPIALGIVRTEKSTQNLLLMLIMVPFWTSLLIRVYSWSIILKTSGLLNNILIYIGFIDTPLQLLNSQFAVILGIVHCYLPFMVLPLYLSIEKINPALIEASLDLGCTPFRSFLHVILPLSIPGIIAGSMLVFIPAVGEFVIPELLGGAQVLTVGKVIWNEFFQNHDWPIAAAITVALTMSFIIPVMIIQKLLAQNKNYVR
ncbi:MAG: ABC transporter permease subunit [Alphaproteobacteria bacterium]|jgi:putrescine transport system permease protein